MANPKLFRTIDKAVSEYNMIEEDDRILIAASGGKDSTALAEYFAARLHRRHPVFEAAALHIATDIGSAFAPELAERFKSWGIELNIKTISVLERLKTGKKMNCWWCSTQRRTELLHYAIEHKFNKIALGHHLDDILETLLMNMLERGELSTMPPKLSYENYPVTILRPLCYVGEKTLIDYARLKGFASSVCTCDYQDNSGRKKARLLLEGLTGGNDAKKMRLFLSLKNIRHEYLP